VGAVIIHAFMTPVMMLMVHGELVTSNQQFDGKLDEIMIRNENPGYKVVVYPSLKYNWLTLSKLNLKDSNLDGFISITKTTNSDVKIYTSYKDWYWKQQVKEKDLKCSDFGLNLNNCLKFLQDKSNKDYNL